MCLIFFRGNLTMCSIELQRIIRQAFGDEAQIAASLRMPTGTVNRTWLVDLDCGEQVIVRIGPGEAQVAMGPSWLTSFGLRREKAAIRLLSPMLDILPVTLEHDFSRAAIDGDWVVQRVMPGSQWTGVVPSLPEMIQNDLWRQLGAVVSTLHAIAGDWFGAPAFGPAFPTWPDLIRADLAGLLADARRYRINPAPFATLGELVDRHADELSSVRPRLIHSDLALDHVFAGEVREAGDSWRISGLIDLEFARFADPASEGLLLDLLGRSDPAAMAFFAGYGGRPAIPSIRQEIAHSLNHLWWITDEARRLEGA
jgi:hypothetical protein